MVDVNFSRSRRDVLKAGALTAAASGATPFAAGTAAAQGQDADRATLDRLTQTAGASSRRILLKGATILSMDAKVGDFARGDILIEGKKIAAVGADLSAASAGADTIVIEAADRVIIPGMVDCHRHSWEGQLRGIIPNSATIGDYMGATHRGFAPFYQPEDMYVGNLATALGCLDAGITCVIDNSHNARSPAHSDAAIQAWFDSGLRAVHASGSRAAFSKRSRSARPMPRSEGSGHTMCVVSCASSQRNPAKNRCARESRSAQCPQSKMASAARTSLLNSSGAITPTRTPLRSRLSFITA